MNKLTYLRKPYIIPQKRDIISISQIREMEKNEKWHVYRHSRGYLVVTPMYYAGNGLNYGTEAIFLPIEGGLKYQVEYPFWY